MTFVQPPTASPPPQGEPPQPAGGYGYAPTPGHEPPPDFWGGPLLPPKATPGGTNWALLIVVIVASLLLSCGIIVLSGLAGYTDGVRLGRETAQAGQQATAARQFALLETDVAAGNYELGRIRAEAIATLGIGEPGMAAVLTQVFVNTPTPTFPPPTDTLAPPTATLAPSATFTVQPAVPTSTPGSVLPGTLPDIATVFAQAQTAYNTRDWTQAIGLLDIVRGLDESYQTGEVERMLRESLMALSRQYLLDPAGERLAEGILLANRARAFGSIGDLQYEAYVAGLYLEARSAEGMDCLTSVAQWQRAYAEAPNYRDVASRAYSAYLDCANAYISQGEYCPAVQYLESALRLSNDLSAAGQRDLAVQMCAQATPTPGTPTPEGLPADSLQETPAAPPEGGQPAPAN